MDSYIDKLFKENKLFYCVECGKCTSVCPMQDIFSNFSYNIAPRGIIKKASMGLEILKREEIWFCQECTACTEICPSGVKYADFIRSLRQLAVNEGIVENCFFCERCGQYYITTPTLESIKETLGEKELSDKYLNLCPKCRKHDYLTRKKGLG